MKNDDDDIPGKRRSIVNLPIKKEGPYAVGHLPSYMDGKNTSQELLSGSNSGTTVVWSLVYADKPQTLDHLEDKIRRVIADIRPQMLEKVIENWTSRLDYIRASRGSHMPEIIFKL
ncbi:hypothetical protein TNCV_3411641 [Trichonephila clavipes]|nr:hypothetical protein TNCV_3411641 [Trichonephila clavipes]